MNFLKLWTACFVVLNFNLSFVVAVNETDVRSGSIGAERTFNATTEGLPTEVSKIKRELYIGGLFDLDTHYGAGELYAAMMAVKEINRDPTILADYRIFLYQERSTEVS